jgi:ribonuclease E
MCRAARTRRAPHAAAAAASPPRSPVRAMRAARAPSAASAARAAAAALTDAAAPRRAARSAVALSSARSASRALADRTAALLSDVGGAGRQPDAAKLASAARRGPCTGGSGCRRPRQAAAAFSAATRLRADASPAAAAQRSAASSACHAARAAAAWLRQRTRGMATQESRAFVRAKRGRVATSQVGGNRASRDSQPGTH